MLYEPQALYVKFMKSSRFLKMWEGSNVAEMHLLSLWPSAHQCTTIHWEPVFDSVVDN
jgi:hypothetical protein